MTLSDLKYITPIDIQNAYLNITSSDMYAEAKKFNKHMYDMQRKRWRFLRDFWSMILLNVFMLALGAATSASSYTSLLFRATGGRGPFGMAVGGNMLVTVAPAAVYTVLFVWLILIRRTYDWRLILAMSAVLVPVNYAFIALAIANVILIRLMDRTDNEIKDEIGYPHFVELTLSYIRDEEGAEDGDMDRFEDGEKSDDLESERKENPFDKYRTYRQDDEGGLLRDNDITNIAKE